jgi:hypothetical protein
MTGSGRAGHLVSDDAQRLVSEPSGTSSPLLASSRDEVDEPDAEKRSHHVGDNLISIVEWERTELWAVVWQATRTSEWTADSTSIRRSATSCSSASDRLTM